MNLLQKIIQDMEAFKEVFSNKKYFLFALIMLVAVTIIYSVLTDILLIIPQVEINPKLNYLNLLLIFLIGILTSLVLSFTFYRLKKNWQMNSGEKTGFIGSLIGVFASVCPICQPIWLVWLGLGSASAFLIDYSTYIALASIALLLVSLHLACQSIYTKTCEIKKK